MSSEASPPDRFPENSLHDYNKVQHRFGVEAATTKCVIHIVAVVVDKVETTHLSLLILTVKAPYGQI